MIDLEQTIKNAEKNNEEKKLTEEIKNLKNKIKNEAKQRSWFIGEWVLTLFFMIITFFIVGLPSLFEFGWDWSIYASKRFWTNYFMVQTASWFARVWILMLRTRRNEKFDDKYTKSSNEIQGFIDMDAKTPFINYNCRITNKERKIRAWKNKQILTILELSRKISAESIINTIKNIDNIDLEAFEFKSGLITKNKKGKPLKRKIRLIDKNKRTIKELLKTITSEYIETNFDNLKVKYNVESRSVLATGYAPKNENAELGVSYKKHKAKKFFEKTLPTFLFISAIMFLLVPLLGELSKDWNAWYQFITNSFLVFASASMMWLNADEIFTETDLRVLLAREDTLRRFSTNLEPKPVIVKKEPINEEKQDNQDIQIETQA